jgi:nucleotide-binding universal stress UspA family protein
MMKGRELLDALYEEFSQQIPVETQLIEGPPAPAIIKVADTEHFDLIVLGSRGHGQVVNLLLGSVSSAVTQKAHCPVLVVH